jgi:hypothetical protein
VQAWGPTLLWIVLTRSAPGSAIRAKPSEAYIRAKRDRELILARRRAAADDAAAEQGKRDRLQADRNREFLFGPRIDEMSDYELEKFARDVLEPFMLAWWLRAGRPIADGLVRHELLRELERRSAATVTSFVSRAHGCGADTGPAAGETEIPRGRQEPPQEDDA